MCSCLGAAAGWCLLNYWNAPFLTEQPASVPMPITVDAAAIVDPIEPLGPMGPVMLLPVVEQPLMLPPPEPPVVEAPPTATQAMGEHPDDMPAADIKVGQKTAPCSCQKQEGAPGKARQ